ncbi:hypothetical protein BD410DRAFT_302868 [Rickenella mellea]|uniref:Uncharacterized protein n=1 Tax=Rickenella mellea TaxID=50990 RepID=A0A4Y7Q1T8_9AGAM|nr:hypothetical protein BD410DRAFT_302868 [Rickenella mellea]
MADTNPSYNVDAQYTAPVVLLAFLISLTWWSAIEAGVSTVLVTALASRALMYSFCKFCFVGFGREPRCSGNSRSRFFHGEIPFIAYFILDTEVARYKSYRQNYPRVVQGV